MPCVGATIDTPSLPYPSGLNHSEAGAVAKWNPAKSHVIAENIDLPAHQGS